jgi:peptidoglycan/LPS O-acetylase OafA/YrhL
LLDVALVRTGVCTGDGADGEHGVTRAPASLGQAPASWWATRPQALASWRTGGRLPALDVVRAVAVLEVVLFHVRGSRFSKLQGYRGVDIFFILSGLLITSLALREERTRGRVDIQAFALRRFFRIFPLYWLMLLFYVVTVLGLHQDDRQAVFRAALPWFLLSVQEWQVFHHVALGLPYGATWSLGIEEKFYLLWPFLGFVLLRGRRWRPQAVATLMLGLLVVTAVKPQTLGQMVFSYAPILLGCLLAFLLDDPRSYAVLRHLGTPRVLVPLLLICAGLWLVPLHQSAPFVPLEDFPLFLVPCSLAIAGLAIAPAAVADRLSPRWLVHIGRLSYALYLTHEAALNVGYRLVPSSWEDARFGGFLMAAVCLALALPVCEVLHRVVEQPLIRVGHRLATRHRTQFIQLPEQRTEITAVQDVAAR